jgi:hypothetical protein
MVNSSGSVVAQVMIELIESFGNVLISPAIYDIQSLACVGVEKPQPVFLQVVHWRAAPRASAQKNDQQRDRKKRFSALRNEMFSGVQIYGNSTQDDFRII